MAEQKGLTRDQHTIAEHHFKTDDDLHTLYVQEWGNPSGVPIFYIHGGPGDGCDDGHKKAFDPKKHRVVFHDQRGSGQSKPYASMKANSTQNLVEDIEMIRTKLGLKSFVLFGRSWGSTLSFCYAIKYPKQVTKIVTGGIFLGTRPEINWIEKGGFKDFFPEVWDKYGEDNLSSINYARIAASAMKIDDRYPEITDEDFDAEEWVVERGYLKENCFLPDNYILNNANKLKMPVSIVQGRYDTLCPPIHAYQLHKVLPNSTLQWTIAGHSSSDRANFDVSKAILSQL